MAGSGKSASKIHKINKVKVSVKILFWTMLGLLAVSFVYSFVSLFYAPKSSTDSLTKSNYILMSAQCLLGIFVLLAPSFLEKKLCIEIPSFMEILLILFVFTAIFLGEIRFYYKRFEYWDIILHVFSGLMIGLVGFSLVNILNNSNRLSFKLSPGFVALFAFSFAMAAVTVWEIYEFLMDDLFGLDMQKFLPPFIRMGEHLTEAQIKVLADFYNSRNGYRYALNDTMVDLVVDLIGATFVSGIGFFLLKTKSSFFNKTLIKITRKSEIDQNIHEKHTQ